MDFLGPFLGDAKLEPCDFTGCDVIVLDEVYFSNLSTYWRIKQCVEQNKHNKMIIATCRFVQARGPTAWVKQNVTGDRNPVCRFP